MFLVGQSYTMGDEVKPCKEQRCVKNVRTRSYSGPYFPPFGLNTEKYGLSLRIQSECPENTDQINSEYGHFLRSASFTSGIKRNSCVIKITNLSQWVCKVTCKNHSQYALS